LGRLGFIWGVAGVIGILISAILRLSARVVEMLEYAPGLVHWLVLVLFALYMAYAEGYKGFHLNFAPRVVLRASHLLQHPRLHLILLAPLFCMGFIHATRRRQLISLAVSAAIISVVILVSMMPQPWRGVIDAGVVLGMLIGVASIVFFCVQVAFLGSRPDISADLPEPV
jgi:hypothetical protein